MSHLLSEDARLHGQIVADSYPPTKNTKKVSLYIHAHDDPKEACEIITRIGCRLFCPIDEFISTSRVCSAPFVLASTFIEGEPPKDLGIAEINGPMRNIVKEVNHILRTHARPREQLFVELPRKRLRVVVVELGKKYRPWCLHNAT